MIKSVLVAALSVALISTGFASGHKKPTTRAHSKKASVSSKAHKTHKSSKASKSSRENNRKATSKTYNRGRRYVEEKSAPVHHVSHSSSKHDIGRATVTGTNINVRSGPSTSSDVVAKVSGGNVAITAQKGEWYKLRFQYGTEGWIREEHLSIAGKSSKSSGSKMTPIKLDPINVASKTTKDSGNSESSNRYATLKGTEINIRRGPSTSNSSAMKATGGKVLVVDKWDDWYKVRFDTGKGGWVRKDYLNFPSNFDFKNSASKPVAVATKTKPIEKGTTPENTVEDSKTGERTSVDAEVRNTSSPMSAKVIGDGIAVRRGASATNSLMMTVNGGPAEIIDRRGNFVQLRFPHGTIGWVNEKFVSYPGHEVKEPERLVANVDGDKIAGIMQNANAFVNSRTKYVYGANSRYYTDCSGFTLQVFRAVGINLPRTAREQAQRGVKVGRWDLKTGDLVFFNTRGYISHVGIYVGDQKFVHASSGGGRVMQSSLNETYYGNRFLFGKRIVAESKVKKLDLPKIDEVPTEKDDQRGDDDNKVEISKGQKNNGDSNSPSH